MRSKAASGVRIPASPPFASVAQLDRVLGYEPSGRRFESSRMHHILRTFSDEGMEEVAVITAGTREDNVASATARRASEASHPARPTTNDGGFGGSSL